MSTDKYLQQLQEGAFFKSRIAFYEKTIPGFIKALQKALGIVKKYKVWHAQQKKKEPDKWDPPAIEFVISQQSVIGNVAATLSKRQAGNVEKYRFEIHDGDNAGASEFGKTNREYVAAILDFSLRI